MNHVQKETQIQSKEKETEKIQEQEMSTVDLLKTEKITKYDEEKAANTKQTVLSMSTTSWKIEKPREYFAKWLGKSFFGSGPMVHPLFIFWSFIGSFLGIGKKSFLFLKRMKKHLKAKFLFFLNIERKKT